MKESAISIPAAGKWITAFAIAQWLRIPALVQVLLMFMAADYLTGLAAAYVRRELSSSAATRGLVRKALVVLLLVVLRIGGRVSGLELHLDQVGAIGYIVSEFISIVENVAKAGVPVPAQVVSALLAAKKLQRPATQAEIDALASGNISGPSGGPAACG